MSFPYHHGPEILPEGGVIFNLYSPNARQVELVIEGRKPIEMPPFGRNGWRQIKVLDAGPGTLYHFRLNGDDNLMVPDFGSRFQPRGIPGPSEVIDLAALPSTTFQRPDWASLVMYQLHVGAYTEAGDYDALAQKLDHIKNLGINAIQLMPLHEIPGDRTWGYDIALPFAIKHNYGRPEDLKRLINLAHDRGIAVMADVVYNHFGPDGNHTPSYATAMTGNSTVWGDGPDFTDTGVRQYIIQHMRYMLKDLGFDGLRLDACHAIVDNSATHILDEAQATVRAAFPANNQPYLVQENDRNERRFLMKGWDGVWAGDTHNALRAHWLDAKHHYYKDYAETPLALFNIAFAEGYGYQGQVSKNQSEAAGKDVFRGEASADIPPQHFIKFFENHDQIGNSASARRLMNQLSPAQQQQLNDLLWLSPHIPLFFMGQNEGSTTPFHYFTDWAGELAEAVKTGRLEEYRHDPDFDGHPHDPNAPQTFLDSKLNWQEITQNLPSASGPPPQAVLRQERIVPLIRNALHVAARQLLGRHQGTYARWESKKGDALSIVTNLSGAALKIPRHFADGEIIWRTRQDENNRVLVPNQSLYVVRGPKIYPGATLIA